jgi:hypothetical protein
VVANIKLYLNYIIPLNLNLVEWGEYFECNWMPNDRFFITVAVRLYASNRERGGAVVAKVA